MRKKIVTVLGARPQFVKAAVLSRIIKEYDQLNEVIIHTGQHFDDNMSAVFFDEMQIPKPSYHLEIHSLNHGAMTGQMLEEIEKILLIEEPDAVVVYGDTNSTIAGALAAKKLGVKVIHIEAGLRSFNMEMPEEINRILTDRISDLLICPTDIAVDNLKAEGFENLPVTIVKHGDIMKDAVLFYSTLSEKKSSIISDLNLENTEFVLATIHRQENTNHQEQLSAVFKGLERISEDRKVVLPLHPRTRKMLEKFGITTSVNLIEPVGYFDMLELLKHCTMVVTDSGGLQKEAFFNRKYCIIARGETEWKELVANGYARLVGTDARRMVESYEYFQETRSDFDKDLYGTKVGERIHESIVNLIAN